MRLLPASHYHNMLASIIPVSEIILGTDHAGFEAKEGIKVWLESEGFVVRDCGAFIYDTEDDYPIFIVEAAKAVAATESAVGIVFGGSGQGEAMMANRIPGVRAVAYYGHEDSIITLSREHNGANILSFGARFVGVMEMKRLIALWLQTPAFTDEKYKRRALQMDGLLS